MCNIHENVTLPGYKLYFCTTLKKGDHYNSFRFELSPQQQRIPVSGGKHNFFILIYQSSYTSWVRVHVYGSKVYAHTPRTGRVLLQITPELIFVVSQSKTTVHPRCIRRRSVKLNLKRFLKPMPHGDDFESAEDVTDTSILHISTTLREDAAEALILAFELTFAERQRR